MRRFWKPFLLGVLVLLGVTLVRAMMPRSVDTAVLEAAGEGYQATIVRDDYGVPHIFGATDADVAYGLAYAHAEDNFRTIQESLLPVRGLTGTLYGLAGLSADVLAAALRVRENAARAYPTLPADLRAVLEGYAAGLNRYAARHPDEILHPDLFPVRGEDLVAASLFRTPLFFDLDNEIQRLLAAPPRPHDADDVPGQVSRDASRYGSNVFAVGRSRTADGSVFFAANPHQPWEGPVAWYEAHLHSEQGWNAVGGLFPGSPFVIVGHNEHIAWSFTVNEPDLVDFYRLTVLPDFPDGYLFDGVWRPFEVRWVWFRVRVWGPFILPVPRKLEWAVQGPVVRTDHGVYAVRYPRMGQPGVWEQLYRLNKARNLEEFRAALRKPGLPMFNVGYADAEGNLFYVYNALLPLRPPGYPWEAAVPGDTSATLWTETLPFDDLPQVLNPAADFFQNANSSPFRTSATDNPDPAAFDPNWGIEQRMTNRALRLLTLLAAAHDLTWEDFLRIKRDVAYDPQADPRRAVDLLLRGAPPTDPDQKAAWDLLQAWDGRLQADDPAATVASLTLYYLYRNPDTHIRGSKLVGGRFTADQVQAAFAQAVDHLKRHFGRVDVPWGEVNRLCRGDRSWPLFGGPDTVFAVYGEMRPEGHLCGIAGDSYVQLVRFTPEGTVQSWSIVPYGASTHPESPHYADQAPLFAAGEYKPTYFHPADLEAHTERVYRP